MYSNLTYLASFFLTIIIAIAPFSDKMPKTGPKLKNASQPRHNPYKYRIPGPFLGDTNAFLQAARGQDSIEDTIDNSDDETRRRRSWTREQKLGAIKYATSLIYYIKYT